MLTNNAPVEMAVLRTLAYYDIFNYPLTERDIAQSCPGLKNSLNPYKNALINLTEKGIIFKFGNYYSLTDNHQNVKDRIAGNDRAKTWMKKAYRFSRLIAGFPFVRSVALSGSLSKGFMGDDPDIDYFIITEPNRLWLARTMLVVFKKIFLLNSYKYFCINYFIDTENLEIEEKNLFTATEVTTLKPIYGAEFARKFFEKNRWVEHYFPHFNITGLEQIGSSRTFGIKRFIEMMLTGKHGDWLDTRFMKITIDHWSSKFGNRYSPEEFSLVFKSSKKISKHHPQNFQKKVLQEYNRKLLDLKEKFNIEIEPEPAFPNLS